MIFFSQAHILYISPLKPLDFGTLYPLENPGQYKKISLTPLKQVGPLGAFKTLETHETLWPLDLGTLKPLSSVEPVSRRHLRDIDTTAASGDGGRGEQRELG